MIIEHMDAMYMFLSIKLYKITSFVQIIKENDDECKLWNITKVCMMDSSQPSEHQLPEPIRCDACSETMVIECLYVLLYTIIYKNTLILYIIYLFTTLTL